MAARLSLTRAPSSTQRQSCLPIDTLDRANGFPQIAIDPKSNRIYITWSDYRNGDLDVFVSSSARSRQTLDFASTGQ